MQLWRRSGFCPPRLEFLNAASGVNQLFLAGVERVALAADFHIDFLFRGSYGECIPAGAMHDSVIVVLWVDILFHFGLFRVNIAASVDFYPVLV